ncbi:MAG: hypothetical protein ABI367_00260 [Mucilaginibacter sp.]
MSKKYFYFYLGLGIAFLLIGIISLIRGASFTTSLYDFIPAAILLYATFKIQKMKKDSEVM